MDSIVKRLAESRLYEARKRDALNSIAKKLAAKLSAVEGYSHHKLSISPNYGEGRVDVFFRGTKDRFSVYPHISKIPNENSNTPVKVSDIQGAYIEDNKVYDINGDELGDALVRVKATHSKSEYSDSLEKAKYNFNSQITDLRRLEKYIASEAINNMK